MVKFILIFLLFITPNIFCQENSGYLALTEIFRVNTDYEGEQEYLDVVSISTSNFAVVWESQDASGSGIFLQVLQNKDGSKVGDQILVNTYVIDDQEKPQVDKWIWGGFVVMWESIEHDPVQISEGIRAQYFTENGEKTQDVDIINVDHDTGGQFLPAISLLENDKFVVVFRTGVIRLIRKLMDKTTTDYGEPSAGEISSSQINNFNVAPLKGGGYVIAADFYESSIPFHNVVLNLYRDDNTWFQLIDCIMGETDKNDIAVLTGGNIVVIYESYTYVGIYFQIYTYNGEFYSQMFDDGIIVDERLLSGDDFRNVRGFFLLFAGLYPTLGQIPYNRFIVCFVLLYDQVHCKIFNDVGNPVTELFRADDYSTGTKKHTRVTERDGGGFIVCFAGRMFIEDNTFDIVCKIYSGPSPNINLEKWLMYGGIGVGGSLLCLGTIFIITKKRENIGTLFSGIGRKFSNIKKIRLFKKFKKTPSTWLKKEQSVTHRSKDYLDNTVALSELGGLPGRVKTCPPPGTILLPNQAVSPLKTTTKKVNRVSSPPIKTPKGVPKPKQYRPSTPQRAQTSGPLRKKKGDDLMSMMF